MEKSESLAGRIEANESKFESLLDTVRPRQATLGMSHGASGRAGRARLGDHTISEILITPTTQLYKVGEGLRRCQKLGLYNIVYTQYYSNCPGGGGCEKFLVSPPGQFTTA